MGMIAFMAEMLKTALKALGIALLIYLGVAEQCHSVSKPKSPDIKALANPFWSPKIPGLLEAKDVLDDFCQDLEKHGLSITTHDIVRVEKLSRAEVIEMAIELQDFAKDNDLNQFAEIYARQWKEKYPIIQ